MKDEALNAELPPLRVRYYRQMKPQRVSTVEVFWKNTKKPRSGEVTVRLLAAGAQVLPAEHSMDAAKPYDKVVFYVTPLARGWLRNLKLEILSQGRKVQEIPMAGKVVSQRFTWFLLFCTFFVPWFITEYIKLSPMESTTKVSDERVNHRFADKEVEAFIKDNVPDLPDYLKQKFPDSELLPEFLKNESVESELLSARSFLAKKYQQLIQVTRSQPLAFYTGLILFLLTLMSAYLHKPKRRIAWGKPIPE